MKIIHCADIHLDSPLKNLGSTSKASERRGELIKAFVNVTEFARREGVSAIIIAGDMFDTAKVSETAKNAVFTAIKDNPDISFYLLKGNHDKTDIFNEPSSLPENLYLFGDAWTSYELGENIYLSGAELNSDNINGIYASLNLDTTHFNIVTLHGQESMARAADGAQVISIKDLKNKGIDYLALGHIHFYKQEKLDARGIYCYPGCLEARGFDETGQHGFMLLDVDGGTREIKSIKMVSSPIREAHVLKVDISGCSDSSEMLKRVQEELKSADYPEKDLVKAELIGEVDFACDKNVDFLEAQLKDLYYEFKLKDNTALKVDYAKYKLDESLKGEFIRTVEAQSELSEEDKAEIIRIGMRALMGEGIE